MGDPLHASLAWRGTVLADTWPVSRIGAQRSGADQRCDADLAAAIADIERLGRYQIEERVGAGAMGVVFRARDSLLDREVALKVLSTAYSAQAREAMLAEARALAKVSHANVVQVHDAEVVDGFVCLVMEYVSGTSLESLRESDVPWRERLRILCAAGRGLAAVHAAGLVHRDFKPANVLLSNTGVVKVADFGLAEVMAEEGDSTPHGLVAGTPAYMSPEQQAGTTASAKSDQFSFAVTLYEALYLHLPFAGESWSEIRESMSGARIHPPAPESQVPKRVLRILLRALSADPEGRWPSVAVMVESLENATRSTRARTLWGVGALVVVSALSYGASSLRTSAEACTGMRAELAGVWDNSRKDATRHAFAATGLSYAEDTWQRAVDRLDAYASSWVERRTSACEAQVSGSLSERLLERQLACMEQRKGSLRTLVELLTETDRDIVENAVQAVASLPSVATCANVERLLAEGSVPDDPRTAERVEALRLELTRAAVLESTGRYDESWAILEEARREARATGFGPLEAEAALRDGSLRIASGRSGDAREALTEALEKAIFYDLDTWAAEAAAKRIFAIGYGERRLTEALEGAAVARALVAKVHDNWRLAALLNNNLGTVYLTSRDYDHAADYFERTISLVPPDERAGEHLIGVSLHNLGEASFARGDFEVAERRYMEAIAHMRETLGDYHPMITHPLAGLGEVNFHRGRFGEAREHYERAMAMMESSYGETSFYLLQPLTGLGRLALRSGELEQAESRFRRATEISEYHGVKSDYLAMSLEGLGEVSIRREDPAQALPSFERAAAVREELGSPPEEFAAAALRAGEAAAAVNDDSRARHWYERILARDTLEESAQPRTLAALGLALQLADEEDATARARACELLNGIEDKLVDSDKSELVGELRPRVCDSPTRQ